MHNHDNKIIINGSTGPRGMKMDDKTLSVNAAAQIIKLMDELYAEDLKAIIDIAYDKKDALERFTTVMKHMIDNS